MKRLSIALSIIFLIACGSKSVVKDENFTFKEDDFIKTYEKVNDMNYPTNINVSERKLEIDSATAEDVDHFLTTVYDITEFEHARRLNESIQNNESNYDIYYSDGEMSINVLNDEPGYYEIRILPYEMFEKKE